MRRPRSDPALSNESEAVAAQREAAAHLTRIQLLERELRALLDNAPLVIFRLDPVTGHLLYLNRHAEKLLGVPLDDALRTPDLIQRIHGEAVDLFEEALAQACRGERPTPYEARLLRGPLLERLARAQSRGLTALPDRTPERLAVHDAGGDQDLVVQSTIYPLLGEHGQVDAVEGILVDVSAEHRARTRLIQADRLFTLGMIAAGVAHEINNPAGFLTLGLTQLERMWPGDESSVESAANAPPLAVQELFANLQSAVDRISVIAKDLRLFANPHRPAQSERTYVDVNRSIEGALTLTRAQIMGQARIVVDLEPVPVVLMNDARLAQVLVNLVINAADAVAHSPGRERVITLRSRKGTDHVEISVANTGEAIPLDLQSRIWLPFFTTKGTGTGLGLAISREIVTASGGTIEVVSPTERSPAGAFGTRFVIRLPLGVPEQGTRVAATSQMAPKQRGLRVLVVDDEANLARAVATAVAEHHEVTVAPDADQALDLLCTDRFDAVLCDLRMPGMSGEALYAELCRRGNHHTRAFVFMTGVGFGQDVDRLLRDSGCPLLEKPFTASQVLAAIETVSRPSQAQRAAR
jgi:signal transduction histidine kinase/CheY-like chemotaxis protein